VGEAAVGDPKSVIEPNQRSAHRAALAAAAAQTQFNLPAWRANKARPNHLKIASSLPSVGLNRSTIPQSRWKGANRHRYDISLLNRQRESAEIETHRKNALPRTRSAAFAPSESSFDG
jgi:hypothetical protein